jgi:hypothetical protein
MARAVQGRVVDEHTINNRPSVVGWPIWRKLEAADFCVGSPEDLAGHRASKQQRQREMESQCRAMQKGRAEGYGEGDESARAAAERSLCLVEVVLGHRWIG